MRYLVLDFETYFDKDFSLTKLTTMEYVLDERFHVWGLGYQFIDDDEGATWLSTDEVGGFIESVDWSDTVVICHNVNFDAFILTQIYGVTPARYVCTAAMSRALYPNSPASLDKAAGRFLSRLGIKDIMKGDALPKAKGILLLPVELEREIADYCCQDVRLTKLIYNVMKARVPDSEMDLIDLTARMFCDPALVLDVDRLEAFRVAEQDRSHAAILASGLERSVLASNKQFAEWLEEQGIKVPRKISPRTGKSIPALGQKDKGYLALCQERPDLAHIWDGRAAAKSRIAETRAERFLSARLPDGTIPMPLKFYGAHTGRFSGNEKMNVQNMPRGSELRKSLCAPDGQFVYVIDLSQIEARMLAWLASEEKLLSIFRENGDVYSDFASRFYGMPINKDDHPIKRFVGKTSVLGLGYGVGAHSFYEILSTGMMGPPVDIERHEAQKLVNFYRSEYSRVPNLWRTARRWIFDMCNPHEDSSYGPLKIKHERIFLPNGLSLHYPELASRGGNSYIDQSKGWEVKLYGAKLIENVIQALSRLVITDAMLQVEAYFRPLGGRVVLTIHDEIVALGPKENADTHFSVLHKIVTTPPAWCSDIPLDAEGGYAAEYSK